MNPVPAGDGPSAEPLAGAMPDGFDRHAAPDRRVEFATQLALWIICDDEQLEEQARAQRGPEDVEAWARQALSGIVARTQLDTIDYVRLYALLR